MAGSKSNAGAGNERHDRSPQTVGPKADLRASEGERASLHSKGLGSQMGWFWLRSKSEISVRDGEMETMQPHRRTKVLRQVLVLFYPPRLLGKGGE